MKSTKFVSLVAVCVTLLSGGTFTFSQMNIPSEFKSLCKYLMNDNKIKKTSFLQTNVNKNCVCSGQFQFPSVTRVTDGNLSGCDKAQLQMRGSV